MPSRVRLFTVPSGSPSSSATCDWVLPSKYIFISTCRCSAGISCNAALTWSRELAASTSSTTDWPMSPRTSSAGSASRLRLRCASSLRIASTARWWTVDMSHDRKVPRSSRYAAGSRHSDRKASCTISSATKGWRTIRTASPFAMGP